jgi:hypothetical protein
MDLYLQALMIQMRLLIGDLQEKVGLEIKPLREQQLNIRICGEELITMWENTEVPNDWQYPKRKIKTYLERKMMPYETEELSIHPGRHFLPTGPLRSRNSLPYYQVEKIIKRGGTITNPPSAIPKMYVGGHELTEVCGGLWTAQADGFRLFRRAAAQGERAMIKNDSDPIMKVIKDMNFTSEEIWELELGSKEKILKHKKRIYDHLLSLE